MKALFKSLIVVGLIMAASTKPGNADSQAKAASVYNDECSRCHDDAEALAKDEIVRVGGELRARNSETELKAFLSAHRGYPSEEDVKIIFDYLATFLK